VSQASISFLKATVLATRSLPTFNHHLTLIAASLVRYGFDGTNDANTALHRHAAHT
jgi:hypothetical protein